MEVNDMRDRESKRRFQHHRVGGCCSSDRHSDKRLWMGIAIILLGVVLLGNNLNFLSYDIRRYLLTWENILILLGLVFFFGKGNRTTGILLFVIGVIFYMKNVLNLIDFNFWSLFWPGLLILMGILMIFRHQLDGSTEKKSTADNEDIIDEIAVFGGGDRLVASQNFQGGKVTTIFGGLNFNMLQAKMAPGDNVLDVFSLFGGMKLIVPEGWNVKIQVFSLFGGFSDKHRFRLSNNTPDQGSQLIIKGTVFFGGGEIKSYFD